MISVIAQASINLGLNVLLFMLITLSLYQNFFSFLDFKIGLRTITHLLQYEDVVGDVYTSFYNFEGFACEQSEIQGIRVVCGNITNFEVAGIIYFTGGILLLCSIVICILNLLMILLLKGNSLTKLRIPHFINAGFYVIISASYFLISNVDKLEPLSQKKVDVQSEFGIKLLFINSAVAIFTLLHYLFVKRFTPLDERMKNCFIIFGHFLSHLNVANNNVDTGKQKLMTAMQSDVLNIPAMIQDKVDLENLLTEKEIEIQKMTDKLRLIGKRTETPGDEVKPVTMLAKSKKPKQAVRGGKGVKREETVENLKEDLEELLNQYTADKET